MHKIGLAFQHFLCIFKALMITYGVVNNLIRCINFKLFYVSNEWLCVNDNCAILVKISPAQRSSRPTSEGFSQFFVKLKHHFLKCFSVFSRRVLCTFLTHQLLFDRFSALLLYFIVWFPSEQLFVPQRSLLNKDSVARETRDWNLISFSFSSAAVFAASRRS